jgi:hypothetical protein
MIPNETLQNVETVGTGVKVVGSFKITDATQARILVSLSDKMYTSKELASVREYSTNAADAHIVAKKPISEIQVELPTLEKLVFVVRDFGSGLSEEQIRDVYCVFGESTKRNSNEQNGLLGYGCKAGFAHADSFTVTSWYNGEKSIYQCVKGDSTKLHEAILLNRSKSNEPTGIEINIPVKQSSLWTFHREAADFYKHWPEVPIIKNMNHGDKERMEKYQKMAPTLKGDRWEIRPKADSSATGVAYMGWVAYPINWNILYNRMALNSQKRVLFELLQQNDVTLHFKMGEVQFVDSREGLEYTDLTLKALMDTIEGIFSKIKDSIQEKFTPAPNLWEAKLIYNAIFGTGILEVEDGENDDCIESIKILEGNLLKLENTFRGAFTWNGIALDSPYFEQINRFDNECTSNINDKLYNPLKPILVTYRKKNKRAKVNRCTYTAHNTITASKRVTIVINDTGKKFGQTIAARYLIFKEKSDISTVYILTFEDDTIKENFYKKYQFYSVPVINLSDIISDAKTWNNANKVTRKYGTGGGGTRTMNYMDVQNGKIEENEVPIREMEDGGYYILESDRRKSKRYSYRAVNLANGWAYQNIGTVAKNLGKLAESLDLDLDKVFIISNQTAESKWFKQAIASGDWTNVWDYVKENLSSLDVVSLIDANNFKEDVIVCKQAANKIKDKITNENSLMLKLIGTIASNDFSENSEISDILKEMHLWDDLVKGQTGTVDFEAAGAEAERQYPFLNFYTLQHEDNMNEKECKDIVRYINAMDLYVDLCPETETKELVKA